MPFATSGEDISTFPSSCFEVIFLTWVFFHMFFFEKKTVLTSGRDVYTRDERGTERDNKKIFNFFFIPRAVVQ